LIARSSNSLALDSKIPRTVTSTALMEPWRVVVRIVSESPVRAPMPAASPRPMMAPCGWRSDSSKPSITVRKLPRSASFAGLTPSPKNDVVVFPVLMSPASPSRGVTIRTWSTDSTSAVIPGTSVMRWSNGATLPRAMKPRWWIWMCPSSLRMAPSRTPQ
jgi:hypothetical protein